MAPEAHLATGSKSLILASYLSTGTTKASIVCFMVLIVCLLVVHWDFGWFTGTNGMYALQLMQIVYSFAYLFTFLQGAKALTTLAGHFMDP